MSENLRKRVSTKKKIEDAFMQLYAEKDYTNIKVKELCEEADIHKSTFYAYYDNLNDLLRTIEDELLECIAVNSRLMISQSFETIEGNMEFMKQKMISHLIWMSENRSYLLPLLGPYGDTYFIRRYDDKLRVAFREGMAKMRLDYGEHPDYSIEYLTGGSIFMMNKWLKEQDIPMEKAADFLIKMGFTSPFIKDLTKENA